MRRFLLVILVACASPATESPEEVDGVVYGLPLPDRENQGRTLLGDLDDLAGTAEHYYVSGNARDAIGNSVTVTVAGAALRVQRGATEFTDADPRMVGIMFDGSDGKTVTITNVAPANAEEPTRYFLSHNGTDPCNGEGAIALAGRVTIDARHDASNGDITFSCEKGVAYKCTKWKYIATDDPTSVAWELQQACMYMAGARYCADRQTFTREGTQVAMFDRPGVRVKFPPDWNPPATWTPWDLMTWPPPHDEFYVEAAWRANGPPRCLSRYRWASLPTAPCGPALPDPRVDIGAQYCEEMIHEGALTPGDIIIVNTSLVNDVALDIWATATGDLLGTVRGFRDEDAGGASSRPPFPGMTYVGHSGVMLRALTSELDPADLVRADLLCVPKTNKCVVAPPGTLPAFNGHTDNRGPEGYLFIRQRPGTELLSLWYDAANNDYVSATTRPGASYTDVAPLGWILKRAPT
jgi:hypothetical protein